MSLSETITAAHPAVNGQAPVTTSQPAPSPSQGLAFEWVFSDPNRHPFEQVEWRELDAEIKDEAGRLIFRQRVRVPASWSDQAAQVVASKYYWGDASSGDDPRTGGREHSVRQLIGRVCSTIARWGMEDGYFATALDARRFEWELTWLCLHQYAAFNSPVWFNVGLHDAYGVTGRSSNWRWDHAAGAVVPAEDFYRCPQGSACFIQSVADDMEGIMALAASEALLFKAGSGTGTDLSSLRSTREKLTGGGKPSGPVSFMRIYDAGAGVIKSGGKSRRAAKMQVLRCDHPDVMEFVECKPKEDRKARALIAAGYSAGMTGHPDEAYSSVFFQNSNLSVGVTDAFMERATSADPDFRRWSTIAVTTGDPVETLDAGAVLDAIALGTWECGDPGIECLDTINRWHTCSNTAPIRCCNPCCFVGGTLVDTSEGPMEFRELHRRSIWGEPLPLVFAYDLEDQLPVLRPISRVWWAGDATELVEVRTERGYKFLCTPEHRFLLHSGRYVQAKDLRPGMRLRKIGRWINEERSGRRCINHRETPQYPSGTVFQNRFVWEQANGLIPDGFEIHHKNEDTTDDRLSNLELIPCRDHDRLHSEGSANPRYIDVEDRLLVETWEMIEAAPRRTHKRASIAVTPGRWNQFIRENGLKGRVPLAGSPTLGGRIRGMTWDQFSAWIEQQKVAVNDRVQDVTTITPPDPVPVYDMDVDGTHNFGILCRSETEVHSVIVHNSEYLFLDDSACNLASLNLMKFRRPDGTFDDVRFRAACRIFITAQEILVDRASYPTQKIAENSHKFRPLGLGYSNLGALIMASGLPYDSHGGRDLAAAVTGLMTAQAYLTSAEIASFKGPFEGFAVNRTPMLRVMDKHGHVAHRVLNAADHPEAARLARIADGAWKECIRAGQEYGYRNAQSTLTAPTGTISFMMDCDTSGLEPSIALVCYKSLAGGGVLKLVNRVVPDALETLGYSTEKSLRNRPDGTGAPFSWLASDIDEIVAYLHHHDTIEGAPHLKPEHLAVFDCAFPARPGGRTIHWRGHVKMVAAIQPLISGASSKTICMPESSTVADIKAAYVEGWKLGVKAMAIYRDGSKGVQPVSTKDPTVKVELKTVAPSDTVVFSSTLPRGVIITGPEAVPVPENGAIAPFSSAAQRPRRERLPATRQSVTHRFVIGGQHEGYATVGLYPDGRPGELFVKVSKEGSTISGLLDSIAILTSLCLQYGVPPDVLARKFTQTRFDPCGPTDNSDLPWATSIPDYIFRWLAGEFRPAAPAAVVEAPSKVIAALERVVERVAAAELPPSMPIITGPPCPECGALLERKGSCYCCANCFYTGGCG